jgi:alpha-glucosidase
VFANARSHTLILAAPRLDCKTVGQRGVVTGMGEGYRTATRCAMLCWETFAVGRGVRVSKVRAMEDRYQPLGAMTPVADQSGAAWSFTGADDARVELTVLAADLARVRLLPKGAAPAASWAVDRVDWPAVDTKAQSQDGKLVVTTAAMSVEIAADPFRVRFRWPDGASFAEDDPALGMGMVAAARANTLTDRRAPAGSLRCAKRLAPNERIFGAGERTSPLDRRGEQIVFYNVDPPQPHGDATRSMYLSIPFWMGVRDGRAYGIFLDSVWRADLDAGASQADVMSFGVAGGDLTYYVFAGPTPAAVLARYADLTGHAPMPPRWALGYGQSRWSYYPEAQARYVAEEFRKRHIPCDSLWLDIDYMDGYRDFTWNERRFPDPAKLARDLAAAGFKLVTIIDPGVKADPTDPTYQDGLAKDYFVRREDGSLYAGVVWPGESVFPDFSRADTRRWWGARHRELLEMGVAAIWDDMNEPALTDRFIPGAGIPHGATMPDSALHWPDGPSGKPLRHEAFHNVYGMQMARATFEGQARLRPATRPFVLSRSGYAGIQRYAAVWTGDNRSEWAHLRLAARMCLGLGLSGLPFVGFDTGGFWLDATGELLVRFTQLGAVFPFFRNHAARRTRQQEPWEFGIHFEALIREAIEMRYRMLPYIYTAFARTARDGSPITRPLVYAWPEDTTLATIEDEFLLGDALLIAPVLAEDQFRRPVTFPKGNWIDWLTGERVTGPTRVEVDAPLDTLPIFAREGAIVPQGPVMQYVGELAEELVTLRCFLGAESGAHATGALYEDDGVSPDYQRGAWRWTHFEAESGDGSPWKMTLRAEAEGQFDPGPRDYTIEISVPRLALASEKVTMTARLDGQPLSGATLKRRRYDTLVRVPLGKTRAPFTLGVEIS